MQEPHSRLAAGRIFRAVTYLLGVLDLHPHRHAHRRSRSAQMCGHPDRRRILLFRVDYVVNGQSASRAVFEPRGKGTFASVTFVDGVATQLEDLGPLPDEPGLPGSVMQATTPHELRSTGELFGYDRRFRLPPHAFLRAAGGELAAGGRALSRRLSRRQREASR
jgi:hypothetical protein